MLRSVKKFFERFERVALPWAKQAIVTHFDKALGQHVHEKTLDEGLGRQRRLLPLAGIGRLVAKGDLAIVETH